jgi:hypothetical protein
MKKLENNPCNLHQDVLYYNHSKKGNHMEFIEKHLLWALFSGWTFVLGMAIGTMA